MVEKFLEAVHQGTGGAPSVSEIVPGKLTRFATSDRRGDESGWCKLFDDCEGGVFGCWRQGISETWQARQPATDEERRAWRERIEREQKQAKQERLERQVLAAVKAAEIWEGAAPATDHPYLQKKVIQAHGARLAGDNLLLPVKIGGKVTSLQYISGTGGKWFFTDGAIQGGAYRIGKVTEAVILCEGFATASTLHEITSLCVLVGFNAGNLIHVARTARKAFPDKKIILAADDDAFDKDGIPREPGANIGIVKATAAAREIGGLLAAPTFPTPRTKDQGSDFNDLAKLAGPEAVKACIEAAAMPTHAPVQENPLKTGNEKQDPEAWPEPLPLLRVTPQNDPFPVEALPSVIQAAAVRVREVVQAPIDLVCQSFLAAATLAVQPYVDVLIDGRRFPVSNDYIVEGVSGERKSAVDRIATGPIKDRQRKEGEQFHAGEKAFEAAHAAWEQKRKAAFKEEDRDVIEAMLKAAGEEPKHVQPVYLFTEPSFQGIERAFAEGRYTLGLFSDEGGRFLGGYAMSKENQTNTITGLSKLWDGDPLDRMRGGDGLTMLYGRRFSVHLMIQPALSGQLFGNSILTGQGFLSRCLCSYPESTIGNRPYKPVDLSKDVAIVAYYKAMEEILDIPLPIHERPEMGLNPRAITLTPAAKSIWISFHDHVEALQKPGGDLFPIIGFASKSAEHAARIAGVLSAFQNPDVAEIGAEYIEAGIAIAEYYLGEALRLFHSSNDDPSLTLAEECFQYGTEKTGGVIGLRNLYQFGPNAVRSQEKAMQIMQVLEEHHRAVKISGGTVVGGKRNRDAWRLIPLEV